MSGLRPGAAAALHGGVGESLWDPGGAVQMEFLSYLDVAGRPRRATEVAWARSGRGRIDRQPIRRWPDGRFRARDHTAAISGGASGTPGRLGTAELGTGS